MTRKQKGQQLVLKNLKPFLHEQNDSFLEPLFYV